MALERHELLLLSTRGSAADSPSVVLAAAGRTWVDAATVEVQAVGEVGIRRVERRWPIEAARAAKVEARVVDVARGGEENTLADVARAHEE